MVKFPTLYQAAADQNGTVNAHWEVRNGSGGWTVRFTGGLQAEEMLLVQRLEVILRDLSASSNAQDMVTWIHDPSRGYSASRGYDWLIRNASINSELVARQDGPHTRQVETLDM
ncbi:hypothetical protein QJS10_CPB13g00305 [Acorus calamus]|uniref:Uncharacterized protein n=1 Tax=Acorus calamus TaxID=4465 RepID=A0AAV9DFJ1_ACOCL|nr:hypothetical protein QJS10_CPB13g00305 [Acorus calamus]